MADDTSVLWFQDVRRTDVARVGRKNASFGELTGTLTEAGIAVPPGFATTADAYWSFIDANGLRQTISSALDALSSRKLTLAEAGVAIRRAIRDGEWPSEIADAICLAYEQLSRRAGEAAVDVAVRSSATGEDLSDASFAGQQEIFLNIRGDQALLTACRCCYASLFTDRAISYREAKGLDPMKVALSISIQRMVRSDLGGAGVMFSTDTETGFDKVVVINATWGLGESIVQGSVDPDEYKVFKPLLEKAGLQPIIEKKLGEKQSKVICARDPQQPTKNVPTSKAERATFVLADHEILTLARWSCLIERHYRQPMDIEWAKDGATNELFIVQARPQTGRSSARC